MVVMAGAAKKIFLGLAVFLTSAVARPEAPAQKLIPTSTPNLKIMRSAHRGVSAYAPENTLPAIQKAIDMGYDYVELDVRYSRDHVPVLMHDSLLTRTTNGFGHVSSRRLEQLKKLDAGALKAEEFKGTRIPTLEEALRLMQGKIKLYLDLKDPPNPELIGLLKKYGFYPDNLVVVHGGNTIPEFLKYGPDAPVMPLLSNAAQAQELLKQFPSAVAFDTKCSGLTPEMVREAHRFGVMVFTDALNPTSKKCMRRPVEYGADLVQFDNPELFSEALRELR